MHQFISALCAEPRFVRDAIVLDFLCDPSLLITSLSLVVTFLLLIVTSSLCSNLQSSDEGAAATSL